MDIKKLEPLAKNEFQLELLRSSIINLEDKTNKLRFNNFAYSIRELSRHILHCLAPEDEIKKCAWYKNESGDPKKITRGERIKYSIQGGLTDEYLDSEIMEISELNSLKKDMVHAITTLSKFTHINDDTFNIDDKKVDELAEQTIKAFTTFHQAISDCKAIICSKLDEKINSIFITEFFETTHDEIDILSTHHSVESYSTSSIHVTNLQSGSIELEVYGSVDVFQQFGSDSDQRRGDGIQMNSSFPFTSSLKAKLTDELPNSELSITKFNVDTSKWSE